MGMYGYFSIWKGMDNRTKKEGNSICLKYYNEKFESRVKPEKKTKE